MEKGPQSNESYERENPRNRTISTVLWVHKKLPQSTVKLVLPSNESYERLIPIRSFQKKRGVHIIPARNSGAGNDCANFMGARHFLILSAGNPHAHKIPPLTCGSAAVCSLPLLHQRGQPRATVAFTSMLAHIISLYCHLTLFMR